MIFGKLFLLYSLIGLGFIGQKKIPIRPETFSNILLKYILPVFVFCKLATSHLDLSSINKIILTLATALIVCLLCLSLSGKIWRKEKDNNLGKLMAAAIPNGNTGYFGIPIALIFFSPALSAQYILANFGITFFQLTIGYYLYAQSQASLNKSLQKLFLFPAFWAFMAGMFMSNQLSLLPLSFHDTLFKIAEVSGLIFSVGGMMLIGIGLAGLKMNDLCWKTILWSGFFCFIIWPLAALSVIFIDQSFFHWLKEDEYKILLLMALCPIGANAVIYATHFDLYPKKAALMVFSSTVIALPVIALGSFFLLS